MAVCDMTVKQVEAEYGPVETLEELDQAVKNPHIFSPDLLETSTKEDANSIIQDEHAPKKKVTIKNVFRTNDVQSQSLDRQKLHEFEELSGWEKLLTLGVPLDQINKIKKKMAKINQRLPIAKL